MERIREECGVFGAYATEVQNLASMTYYRRTLFRDNAPNAALPVIAPEFSVGWVILPV